MNVTGGMFTFYMRILIVKIFIKNNWKHIRSVFHTTLKKPPK
jgi:hypothetical protein